MIQAHLVLSSGGMRTFSYPGALQALVANGVSFTSVSACSFGVWWGAMLCAGVSPNQMIQLIREVEPEQLVGERANPWLPGPAALLPWPHARFNAPGMLDFFKDVVGDPTFDELQLPLATIGLDLISSRLLIYSNLTTPRMKVAEAIRICVSVPFFYPPHVTSERVIIDGALASQCPIWLATVHDASLPIAALLPRRTLRHPRQLSLRDFVTSLAEVSALSRDVQLAEQMPRAVLMEIDIGDVQYDEFDLSSEGRELLVAAGREAAEKNMPRLQDVATALAGRSLPEIRVSLPSDSSNDGNAERGGVRLLTQVNRNWSQQVRNLVFISYAHDMNGANWVASFREMLAPVLRKRGATSWDDSSIPGGANWRASIAEALARTKIAVLLVNRAFLSSKYITEVEMIEIFRAAETEGLVVLWVLVSDCAWQDTHLEAIQCANDPSKPLDSLAQPERETAIAKIARQVGDALA